MASGGVRKSCGNFKDRKKDLGLICFRDFANPWNFFVLFSADDDLVYEWLRNNGLLAREIECDKLVNGEPCSGQMTSKPYGARKGGVFRSSKNRDHMKSALSNSFFLKTKIEFPDVFVFLKSYLDKNSLLQCAKFSGVAYKTTAVHWASFIRELFKEYFHRHTKNKIMTGTVEIDESLFGRRVKYHKGNPNKGMKVWIFGLVDREANNLILYPVADRTKATLLPLIQRHVTPGSTIYSDGWSAYLNLNELGYRHFTVLHKYAFKKEYMDVETGRVTSVDTNMIEGAWKHAKDHFRRIVGTKSGQFEGHLAEIMWRSEHKGDVYHRFFELMKEIFPLDSPADYQYTTPLFDSWEGAQDAGEKDDDERVDKIIPIDSGAETSESEIVEERQNKPNVPMPKPRPPQRIIDPGFEVSSSDDDADKTLTEPGECSSSAAPNTKTTIRKVPASKTDNVCHPSGFVQTKQEGKKQRRRSRKSNQYAKSAYRWDFESDDDDFV